MRNWRLVARGKGCKSLEGGGLLKAFEGLRGRVSLSQGKPRHYAEEAGAKVKSCFGRLHRQIREVCRSAKNLDDNKLRSQVLGSSHDIVPKKVEN